MCQHMGPAALQSLGGFDLGCLLQGRVGLGRAYCLWSVSQPGCPVPIAFLVGHLRRQQKAPALGLSTTTLTFLVSVSAPWAYLFTPSKPTLALEQRKLIMKVPSQQPSFLPKQPKGGLLSASTEPAWKLQAWCSLTALP